MGTRVREQLAAGCQKAARKFDKLLYFTIGALTMAHTTKFQPSQWQFWTTCLVAGCVALKAKRSRGAGDTA